MIQRKNITVSVIVITAAIAWTNLNAKDKTPISAAEQKASARAKKSAVATATPTAANLSVTASAQPGDESVATPSASTPKLTAKSSLPLAEDKCSLKSVEEDKCKVDSKKK